MNRVPHVSLTQVNLLVAAISINDWRIIEYNSPDLRLRSIVSLGPPDSKNTWETLIWSDTSIPFACIVGIYLKARMGERADRFASKRESAIVRTSKSLEYLRVSLPKLSIRLLHDTFVCLLPHHSTSQNLSTRYQTSTFGGASLLSRIWFRKA